jgi:hypothetical protein
MESLVWDLDFLTRHGVAVTMQPNVRRSEYPFLRPPAEASQTAKTSRQLRRDAELIFF